MSEPRYQCARCHAPMHALQNCRVTPEGCICMTCANRPPEPRYLTIAPPLPPGVN